MFNTTEQAVITGQKYRPRTEEIPCVAEAIRQMRQALTNEATDHRWAVGYAEGVAFAMATCDPWCQAAEDVELWRQCARMHDAQRGSDQRAMFRRKRAWFEYIRTAAAWITEDQS